MAVKKPVTIQTGAHQFSGTGEITKYSLSMGGLDTRHDALAQYDIMTTKFYRLFMVRSPLIMLQYFGGDSGSKWEAFKHILEYGNNGVTGLTDSEVQFAEVKGGFTAKTFEIPKSQENGQKDFTVKCYEFSGSIMGEILHTWVNMVVDEDSGFSHYNGMIAAGDIGFSQANQTAEFIYVATDRTGMKVQHAVHLTNCFPKKVPFEHFNADDPTSHDLVELDIPFTCTPRRGWDVNEKAKILLRNHQILTNSLEYHTGLDQYTPWINIEAPGKTKTGYNAATGNIEQINNNLKAPKYRVDPVKTDVENPGKNVGRFKDSSGTIFTTPSFTNLGNEVGDTPITISSETMAGQYGDA